MPEVATFERIRKVLEDLEAFLYQSDYMMFKNIPHPDNRLERRYQNSHFLLRMIIGVDEPTETWSAEYQLHDSNTHEELAKDKLSLQIGKDSDFVQALVKDLVKAGIMKDPKDDNKQEESIVFNNFAARVMSEAKRNASSEDLMEDWAFFAGIDSWLKEPKKKE